MTPHSNSVNFLLGFSPSGWSRSLPPCDRTIYNLNAPSPPTPSICLTTLALHQLAPSPFASQTPVFFNLSHFFSHSTSVFIPLKLPSLIHLPPHFQSAVWAVGVRRGIYGLGRMTLWQTCPQIKEVRGVHGSFGSAD